MSTQYRQGDVLLEKVDQLPNGCTKVSTPNRIILAYGERSGHTHSISTLNARLFANISTDERFVLALQDSVLSHEEHDPIRLPAGVYRVVQQRRFAPSVDRDWDPAYD